MFSFVLIFSVSAAQDSSITCVNSLLWSFAQDIAINDNYAYCGFANGLAIFDVSNQLAPSMTGKLQIPFEFELASKRSIFYSDNMVYINDSNWDPSAGFFIIDVTDNSNPLISGKIITGGGACDITILGNLAYIADGYGGMKIFDIAQPSDPQLLGSLGTEDYAWNIYIDGDYAYLAAYESGLVIIDISDPTAPVEIGSYNPADYLFYDVCVLNNIAFAGTSHNRLFIIDVTDPTAPSEVTNIGLLSPPKNLALSNHFIYAVGSLYLATIDIEDPYNPRITNQYDCSSTLTSVKISNNKAYLTSEQLGIKILGISLPELPMLLSEYRMSYCSDIFCLDGIAYAATGLTGLQSIDISDPGNAHVIGVYSDLSSINRVWVEDNYAYIARSIPRSFSVIDISNPSQMVMRGNIPHQNEIWDIYKQDQYIYLSDSQGYLKIINVLDPDNPIISGEYQLGDVGKGLSVSGDYAFVATGAGGLKIIYISDPSNPIIDGILDINAQDIFINNDLAFIVGNWPDNGLYIYNVAEPLNPILLSYLENPGALLKVVVAGNNAYIAGDSLIVVDIYDPANPELCGSFRTPGEIKNLYCYDGNIYIADYYSLYILNHQNTEACYYVPGDINGDGHLIGSDVTFGVNYFRGGAHPPDSCWNNVTSQWQYSAADANGDCHFIGSDITYLVNYFRGVNPLPQYCIQTPPAGQQ